jgi:hypothetical protein
VFEQESADLLRIGWGGCGCGSCLRLRLGGGGRRRAVSSRVQSRAQDLDATQCKFFASLHAAVRTELGRSWLLVLVGQEPVRKVGLGLAPSGLLQNSRNFLLGDGLCGAILPTGFATCSPSLCRPRVTSRGLCLALPSSKKNNEGVTLPLLQARAPPNLLAVTGSGYKVRVVALSW